MINDKRLRSLINGYISGNIDLSQKEELEGILTDSADARKLLVEYRAMDTALQTHLQGDTYRVNPIRRENRANFRFSTWILAAAAVLMFGILLLLNLRPEPAFAQVVKVEGEVNWISDGSQVIKPKQGEWLPTGILETTSPDSHIDLECRDGSRLTVASESLVLFFLDGAKTISIRKGILSADFAPQNPKDPIQIETPTANFTVVGTRLEIEADHQYAMLSVSTGQVHAVRKIDGAEVEVNQNQSIRVSLDTRNSDLRVDPVEPSEAWSGSFGTGYSRVFGEWQRTAAGQPPRLRSTPFLVTKAQVDPIVTYRCGYEIPWSNGEVVKLEEDAVVHVRGKIREKALVEIMLGTSTDARSFAGNYFYREEQQSGEPFEMEIPLRFFVPANGTEGVPVGKYLRRVMAITSYVDAGLELEFAELKSKQP